ncbi:6-phosphofructokinase [candidate division KSB3 bacterium]|uniref:Pyrophosphate--fructose 6-phosphate 1-phosphotransferase n=1 Tax=candidate division KSB3 bacterium TaxID=2044937 RepID=A0A2G6KDT8_9BACT|nr:MAG: 6-phosphofructokinase [candidate division KSB3 bacterium]
MAENKKTLAIMCGGGPAPGLNGVINAAAIEAINRGIRVLGIYDGFQWLAQGDTTHVKELTIEDVSRIHFQGGSMLRTSRENPTKDPKKMENVVKTLLELNVDYLVTIGGDDTALSSKTVEANANGKIKVAHVPKTIDNDLPLPSYAFTFGYQTARHVGAELIQNLMEDAETANRWYFVVAMGRHAGHLALGIGKAAAATLTIVREEFGLKEGETIRLKRVSDIILGSIIKRLAMGRHNGVVVIAEGVAEIIDEKDLEDLVTAERDEFGHIRLAEVDFGDVLKKDIQARLKEMNVKMTVISKNIGYELRCAPPIPFDAEYTRELGYGVVRFLLKGGTGAIVTIQAGEFVPMYFADVLDPKTNKTKVRMLNVKSNSYEVAQRYMIRLTKEDFEDAAKLKELADLTNMSPEAFKKAFEYTAWDIDND